MALLTHAHSDHIRRRLPVGWDVDVRCTPTVKHIVEANAGSEPDSRLVGVVNLIGVALVPGCDGRVASFPTVHAPGSVGYVIRGTGSDVVTVWYGDGVLTPKVVDAARRAVRLIQSSSSSRSPRIRYVHDHHRLGHCPTATKIPWSTTLVAITTVVGLHEEIPVLWSVSSTSVLVALDHALKGRVRFRVRHRDLMRPGVMQAIKRHREWSQYSGSSGPVVDVDVGPRLSVPFVRRLTGGAAALVIVPSSQWYCRDRGGDSTHHSVERGVVVTDTYHGIPVLRLFLDAHDSGRK